MITSPPATEPTPVPHTVFWEVTNRCNLACEHCYNKPFLNDRRFTLTLHEGLARCHQLIDSGVRTVIFLGGEPLADRNLLRYIEMLRAADVNCSVSTNATLIDSEVAAALARLKVFLISVSLDSGIPELNDLVRGAGTFSRILAGLITLAEHRADGYPRITLACTLSRENSAKYEPLFRLAKQVGIVDVFFNKYQKVNASSLSVSDAESFVEDLEAVCHAAASVGKFYLYVPTMPRVADYLRTLTGVDVIAKEENCGAIDEAVLLSDDNRVYACSMARVERPEFGVEFEGSLSAALQSPALTDFVATRARMRRMTPAICLECVYLATCATRCVLTSDQTKYHLACEAVERRCTEATERSGVGVRASFSF